MGFIPATTSTFATRVNLRRVALLLATGAVLVGCGEDSGAQGQTNPTDSLTIDPPRCELSNSESGEASTLVDLDTRKASPARGDGPPYKWELVYVQCGYSSVAASGGVDHVGTVGEIGAKSRDECMSASQTDTRLEFEMDEVLHQKACLITSEGNLMFIEFTKLSLAHGSADPTDPTQANDAPAVTLRYRDYGPV